MGWCVTLQTSIAAKNSERYGKTFNFVRRRGFWLSFFCSIPAEVIPTLASSGLESSRKRLLMWWTSTSRSRAKGTTFVRYLLCTQAQRPSAHQTRGLLPPHTPGNCLHRSQRAQRQGQILPSQRIGQKTRGQFRRREKMTFFDPSSRQKICEKQLF